MRKVKQIKGNKMTVGGGVIKYRTKDGFVTRGVANTISTDAQRFWAVITSPIMQEGVIALDVRQLVMNGRNGAAESSRPVGVVQHSVEVSALKDGGGR